MSDNNQVRACMSGAPNYQPCQCGYVDLTTEACWHLECKSLRAEIARLTAENERQRAVVDAARAECQRVILEGVQRAIRSEPYREDAETHLARSILRTLDGEP